MRKALTQVWGSASSHFAVKAALLLCASILYGVAGLAQCGVSAPTVTTPVTYCQGATATQLTATGSNLYWNPGTTTTTEVGGSAFLSTVTFIDGQYGPSTNYTSIATAKPNVVLVSVDYTIPAWQAVTGLVISLYNSSNTLLASSPAYTHNNSTASGVKRTCTFNYTIVTPGTYYIRASAGYGNIGGDNPAYPISESSGALTVTGNHSGGYRCFNRVRFSHRTAPTPSTATVGSTNYTVTQTVGTCTSSPATITVVVNGAPATPTFSSGSSSARCKAAGAVSYTATSSGATMSYSLDATSLAAGNTINSSTGAVTYTANWTGTSTITATATRCGLTATATHTAVTSAAPSATISYAGNPYCSSAGTATVTRTGTAGGTYSSTSGLSINASTGAVNLAASASGTYTVTYTIPASGGCAAFSTTTSITVTTQPAASLSYGGSPYCAYDGLATISGSSNASGSFSASPAGLNADAIFTYYGIVNLQTSAPGNYTVTYTVPASGGCAQYTTTMPLVINTGVKISRVPAAGLIAHYKLDGDGLSETGTDYAMEIGSPVTTTDRFGAAGTAYQLNGSNQYLTTISPYTSPAEFTTSLWFKTTTAMGGKLIGFGSSQTGNSGSYDRHVYMNNAGNIYFGVYPSAIKVISSPLTYNDGQWHHVAASLSATAGMKLYVDGALVASDPTTTTAVTYNGYWRIGQDNMGSWTSAPTSTYFNGIIDDVTIHNIALSDAQVDTIYQAATGAANSGPVCAGSPLTLSVPAVAGATYSWTGPNGFTSSLQNPVIASTVAADSGVYAVTVSIGGCSKISRTIAKVYASNAATISYAGSPYCSNAGTASVTLNGATGGTFSSTSGLSLNASTGSVNLAASTPGTYTVTYTWAATANCPSGSATAGITITAMPSATIAYTGNPYCGGTASVTRTGTAGGTYSSTAGLSINASTGAVNVAASTPGTYTVTYTVAAANGCSSFSTTASVQIAPVTNNDITYTNGTSGQLCATPNEGSNAVLTAPAGTYFAKVGFASYGLPTGSCGAFAIGTCHASTSQTVAQTYLLGNNTATIPATNAVFTDPCVGTPKFLYVQAHYAQPICSGTSPGTIVGTTPTGGNGTYTYLWERSTTSATAGFSAASGTNNAKDYTPGALTQTTWFRRTVTSAGCSHTSTVVQVNVTAQPSATIAYTGSPYCVSGSNATVSRTGTAGGTYSSTAGLSVNSTTGAVNVVASTPGTYTVTYTVAASGGCNVYTTTTSITINAAPTATISYAGSPYCTSGGTAAVTHSGTTGGSYASTAGLSINATTGAINLGASTPGTYTVTYTIPAANGCVQVTATTSVTITAAPGAAISYSGSPYCSSSGTASVTLTGTTGGTFSGSAGLVINATTGAVTLGTSTAGTHTVTYTVPAANGCAAYSTTASIVITAQPIAAGGYAGSPFCSNGGYINPNGTANAVGTFSATPAGIYTDAWFTNYGYINLDASAPGTYTITYTVPAGGGCAQYDTSGIITINAAPTGTIAYNGSPYCANAGTATVTQTGTTGGTFSAPAGLAIDASTGAVNLSTSTPGSYIVTYTVAANGCTHTTTAPVTITPTSPASVSIAASATTVCAGTSVTFTATPTNGGGAPSYQWKVNGTNVGTNSTTYTSNSLANGAVVTCVMTSNAVCVSGSPATSNSVMMSVTPVPAVNGAATATACSGVASSIQLSANTPSHFNWTVGAITGGVTGASAGSGVAINQTLSVPGSTAGTVQYLVTPTATNAAYSATASVGNQVYSERLGLVFTVNSPIDVTSLGVFDDGQNGLNGTLQVGIVRNSDGVTVAGPISMAGGSDSLIGGFRTRAISPVTLAAGTYTVVSVGHSASEKNANTAVAPATTAVATNDGGGVITFNSSSYGGVGFGLPTTPYPVNNVFHAGTFRYKTSCAGSASTITVTVNPTPSATIAYTASPYCVNGGTATVTRTGTAAGSYSSTSGLSINASTGAINLGASTPGTYTVTYTVPAAGGCGQYQTTTSITVNPAPTAAIAYTGSPYNNYGGTAAVTQTGATGGTYSSTAGLHLNASTGEINLDSSAVGTYTVTYTVPASGGCGQISTTTTVVVSAKYHYRSVSSGAWNVTGIWEWSANGGITWTTAATYPSNVADTVTVTTGHTVTVPADINPSQLTVNGVLDPASAVSVLGSGTLTGNGTVKATMPAAFATQYAIANKNLSALTVDFAATSAQSISGLAYSNIIVSNTGGEVTTAGAATVSGTLTVEVGAVLNGGSYTIGGSGTLTGSGKVKVVASGTVSGDFDAQFPIASKTLTNLEVEYAGSTAQYVSGYTYSKLKASNSAGLTLAGATTVDSVLGLGSIIDLGANHLTLGVASSITGTPSASAMLVTSGAGEVRKRMSALGTFTFPVGDNVGTPEYSPATIVKTSGSFPANGYISIRVVNAKHPLNNSIANYLNRYWVYTQSGINGNYTGTYNYVTADIVGTESLVYASRNRPNLTPVWTLLAVANAAGNYISSSSANYNAEYTGTDRSGGIYLYRSRANGNWNSSSVWQYSLDGGTTWANAGTYPATAYDTVFIMSPHTVAGNLSTSPAILTVNNGGILNPSAATIFSGSGILSGTGTINVTRTSSGASLFTQYTIANRVTDSLTVRYVANAAQTVSPVSYGKLIIAGTNTKTIATATTAATGNITVESGATLVNSGTLKIAGAISNSGTLTTTAGTIEMNGAAPQTIPAAAFTNNLVKNLTVNNTAGVTLGGALNASAVVKVTSGTLNSGGNLTLLSSASGTALVDGSGGGEITGNVTMQRYLTSRFGYKYISSPFSAATVNELSDDMDIAEQFPTVYRYDENQAATGWQEFTTATDTFETGRGYAANFGATTGVDTFDMVGVVNNGPVAFSGLANHNHTYTQGFNLVGNPYPSPIDWNASAGWTRTNVDDAVYYFDNGSTNRYTGSYSSYINGISSNGVANNIIPAMQGFFVHVSNGSFPVTASMSVTNAARVNNHTAHFHKRTGNDAPLVRLRARFEDEDSLADATVVYLDDRAEMRYEKEMDALKMLNTDERVPNLYSYSADAQKLSISAMGLPGDAQHFIPLGVEVERAGTVHFETVNMEHWPAGLNVFLADRKSGAVQDLRTQPTYAAPLDTGIHENRFFLVFSRSATVHLPGSEDELMAYASGQDVFVYLPGGAAEISILNAVGQVVQRQAVSGTGYHRMHADVVPGVYIATLTTAKGRQSKKVFIGNP